MMPGSAGSKYGIMEDEIPLRLQNRREASLKKTNHQQAELKDIRLVLRKLLLMKDKSQFG